MTSDITYDFTTINYFAIGTLVSSLAISTTLFFDTMPVTNYMYNLYYLLTIEKIILLVVLYQELNKINLLISSISKTIVGEEELITDTIQQCCDQIQHCNECICLLQPTILHECTCCQNVNETALEEHTEEIATALEEHTEEIATALEEHQRKLQQL